MENHISSIDMWTDFSRFSYSPLRPILLYLQAGRGGENHQGDIDGVFVHGTHSSLYKETSVAYDFLICSTSYARSAKPFPSLPRRKEEEKRGTFLFFFRIRQNLLFRIERWRRRATKAISDMGRKRNIYQKKVAAEGTKLFSLPSTLCAFVISAPTAFSLLFCMCPGIM